MTPNQLACKLEDATCELLAAVPVDLDRVQKLLECRAAVLDRIAKYDPSAFTAGELSKLRSAAQKGEAALENLMLIRRGATSDLRRLGHLRSTVAVEPPKHTVSWSG